MVRNLILEELLSYRLRREFFQNRAIASLKLEQRMISRMEIMHEGQVAFSYITLTDFAECQAENADAEALIDTLRSVRGVRVACIMKERDGFVRGSLRAKDDDTDVASIARQLGGGGHRAAAGFTLVMPLEQAISQVKSLLAEA
jgi:phosphoesterase RecJ-like protein